jgi:protein-tyrosine phosphatase
MLNNNDKFDLLDQKCISCINEKVSYYYCASCYDKTSKIFLDVEMKRAYFSPEIDQITEKIYLGNADAARSKENLKEIGISHILMVGNFLYPFFPNDFIYHSITVEDNDNEDLGKYFIECFKFIDSSDKIYIHCQAGRSRSSTIVISYLMYKMKMDSRQALKYVKDRRPVVKPNLGFTSILRNFDCFLMLINFELEKLIVENNITLSKDFLSNFDTSKNSQKDILIFYLKNFKAEEN